MSLWCNLSTDSITGTVTPAAGSSIAIGFWFRADPLLRANGAQQYIYRQEAATNGHILLSLDVGGGVGTFPSFRYVMETSAGSGAGVVVNMANALDGDWHHVVVSDAASAVRFWCDGRLRGTGNTFRSVGYTGAVTTTIAGTAGTNGFCLYDLQLFSRVPNPAEIRAMAEGIPVGASGRYLLGNGVSGDDFSGRGNHITTVSATTGIFGPRENPPWANV